MQYSPTTDACIQEYLQNCKVQQTTPTTAAAMAFVFQRQNRLNTGIMPFSGTSFREEKIKFGFIEQCRPEEQQQRIRRTDAEMGLYLLRQVVTEEKVLRKVKEVYDKQRLKVQNLKIAASEKLVKIGTNGYKEEEVLKVMSKVA